MGGMDGCNLLAILYIGYLKICRPIMQANFHYNECRVWWNHDASFFGILNSVELLVISDTMWHHHKKVGIGWVIVEGI